MAWINDILLKLEKQLLPEGRAFKMPHSGIFEKLLKGLNVTLAQAYTDAISIQDSMIPDNANFTAQDATQWERRLGIWGNAATSLSLRKAAILEKMAYPGSNAPRCSASYLESQLRLAGFDVRIYENRFFISGSWVSLNPSTVLGFGTGTAAYGMFGYGELGYNDSIGASGVNIIANYIEEAKDNMFVNAPNFNSTFFISGATISTFATVPATRKDEFRQLVLALKPIQAIGYAVVTYV